MSVRSHGKHVLVRTPGKDHHYDSYWRVENGGLLALVLNHVWSNSNAMIWGKWSNKWNNSPLQMYHITPTFYALIGNILCTLTAELNIRAVLQRAMRDKNTYVMQVRTALITVGRLWTPTVICLTARRSFLFWGNYILVTIDIAVIPQNTVTYAPIPSSLFTRAESLNGT